MCALHPVCASLESLVANRAEVQLLGCEWDDGVACLPLDGLAEYVGPADWADPDDD